MAVVRSDSDPGVDEKLAECLRFINWFRQTFVRDGGTAPAFYEGLLSDATCAAWNAPALKVKMLAMYLHRDGPESADFASHLLEDTVRLIIADHCVLWGWDVSSAHNWHLIVEMVFENFGNAIGEVFGDMSEEDFPCMILLTRGKEGIDLVRYVPGSVHKFNTVKSLIRAVNLFSKHLQPALAHKENSKKQKSLFCGAGWAKVTEAMAMNASMAAYKFVNSLSEDPDTKMGEDDKQHDAEHKQDIDLGKILSVRQVNSGPGSSQASNSTSQDGATISKHRLKIVEKLMIEGLSARKMKLLEPKHFSTTQHSDE